MSLKSELCFKARITGSKMKAVKNKKIKINKSHWHKQILMSKLEMLCCVLIGWLNSELNLTLILIELQVNSVFFCCWISNFYTFSQKREMSCVNKKKTDDVFRRDIFFGLWDLTNLLLRINQGIALISNGDVCSDSWCLAMIWKHNRAVVLMLQVLLISTLITLKDINACSAPKNHRILTL